jgi:hypothetical protein
MVTTPIMIREMTKPQNSNQKGMKTIYNPNMYGVEYNYGRVVYSQTNSIE